MFAKFRELWSVRRTFQWFRDHEEELPANPIEGTGLVWIPSHSLIRDILCNPFYAGAYVWARRPVTTLLVDGRLEKRQSAIRPRLSKRVITIRCTNLTLLWPRVWRFFLEHPVAERNLARNTQVSCRDTLTLLLPFASKRGRAIDRRTVEDLTPSVVRKFLDHLEHDRQCSGVTRNQRLATIRSLARFIGMRSSAHVAWCAENVIGYLEKAALGASWARSCRQPRRGCASTRGCGVNRWRTSFAAGAAARVFQQPPADAETT